MRYNILPPSGNFYKANLHCHSTFSDGALTPSEIKDLYRSRGYAVVAFTDHELLMDHSYLNDASFLALTGYEVFINESKPVRSFSDRKTTHLNLLASRPDNVKHVCYNPDAVWADPRGIKNQVEHVGEIVNREHTTEFLNRLIREANENGFLVTYNHPAWSLATYDDYKDLTGLFAIEVINGGCVSEGLPDTPGPYDDLLRLGNRLKCVGTDDNHNRFPISSPNHDSMRGWIVIRADGLNYGTIFAAIRRGDFYTSSGPEISQLYVEDNVLHIECSPVRSIVVNSSGRAAGVIHASSGETVVGADIKLHSDFYDYLRVTIEDECGHRAYSNAVSTKDIGLA